LHKASRPPIQADRGSRRLFATTLSHQQEHEVEAPQDPVHAGVDHRGDHQRLGDLAVVATGPQGDQAEHDATDAPHAHGEDLPAGLQAMPGAEQQAHGDDEEDLCLGVARRSPLAHERERQAGEELLDEGERWREDHQGDDHTGLVLDVVAHSGIPEQQRPADAQEEGPEDVEQRAGGDDAWDGDTPTLSGEELVHLDPPGKDKGRD